MSKYIGQLLQSDQRTLDATIERLELVCLHPGVDTKLTAEIITQSRDKVRQLGLDPQQSTKKELYFGLLAKAQSDDIVLRTKLGVSKTSTDQVIAEKIAKQAQKLTKKDIVVCLQTPAIKQILKAVPPKKTMRLLKFRSIDSVLKRENPVALYMMAKKIEDKSWHAQVQARLKRLKPRDVMESPVQIISTPKEWVSKLSEYNFENFIFPVSEVGSILILPSSTFDRSGSVLLALTVILQAAQKLAVESLPYRTKALSSSYEKMLPDIASGNIESLEPIHNIIPQWHVVYQLLAQQQYRQAADFEFILDDLEWQTIETKLASISSELDYWVNAHYLGFPNSSGAPISLHITDVAANLVLKKSYEDRIFRHLKSSLWNELQLRYLMMETMQKSLISQLTLTPEIVL